MDPVLVSLVSAITAMVASILGPIVTLVVAKRQFSANVLSANRQRWLETLRDTLAELVAQIVSVVVLKKSRKDDWDPDLGGAAKDPALMQRIERIVFLEWRVRLLTKPDHADHQELCRIIETTLENLKNQAVNEMETRAAVEKITALSQTILRYEWERVKKGV